jgi:O-methyltransferase involved in polyketide biosynthesis
MSGGKAKGEENTRRIETKASGTADIMCLARAASFKEKRECYSGPDNVAYILVPPFFKLLLKFIWLTKPFIRLFYPNGIYEYIIALTKYIDAAFVQALKQGFEQLVILGAGFDNRTLRFQDLSQSSKIFEPDAPITQKEKLKPYRARKPSKSLSSCRGQCRP